MPEKALDRPSTPSTNINLLATCPITEPATAFANSAATPSSPIIFTSSAVNKEDTAPTPA